MQKMYPIAIAILLMSLLGSIAYNRKPTKGSKPLNGQEAAELVSEFYNVLGPRIGSHLVEPNAALAIAGLSGDGKFFMHHLTDDEQNKIKAINEMADKFGIRFVVTKDLVPGLSDIGILNFKGTEHISKTSKLPFVVPYDATTGIEGLRAWSSIIYDNALKHFKNNGTVAKQNSLEGSLVYLLGWLREGYPDQAVVDWYLSLLDDKKPVEKSHISMGKYYQNPGIDFSYLPEHENDAAIVKTKKLRGDFLHEFYNSYWHKAIAKDPAFIKARKIEDEHVDKWFKTHKRGGM